jgi:xanthine dehydrogenase accessory factor
MKELEDIVKAFDQAVRDNKQTALATVVHVEGSSYRRPGARMLVTEDGNLTGAISGGCLEGDALRKAQLAMAQQQPKVVKYDTTDEDDAKFGVQLGCNGIVYILIEPLSPLAANNPVNLFKDFLSKRDACVLVTLFSISNVQTNRSGTCMIADKEGIIRSTVDNEALQQLLIADVEEALKNRTSFKREYNDGSSISGFIEIVEPPISMVIMGAGNDVVPLVEMSSTLGWHVTVVDGRPNYATTSRFPSAKKVLVAKADKALSQVTIDERTVVLLMTHNYNYDVEILRQLLPLKLSYVGVLGPKKKLDRMFNDLHEAGVNITEEQLQGIYGPVGLDIGAETSEEIALSILAEIKSVFSKTTSTSLREKQQPIHSIL